MKKHWQNYISKTKCVCCSKEFNAYIYNLKRGWGKYCSRACSKKGNTNRTRQTFTEEQKARISQTLKRKFASGELVSPLRSMGLIGKKGVEAMNWQGGKTLVGQAIRQSLVYREWRLAALKDQNYTCAFCKKRGGKLEVDHVSEFAFYLDRATDPSNARVLCKDCHKRVTAFKKVENVDLRRAFVNSLMEIAKTDKRLVVVTCDVGFNYLTDFAKKFPNRYYNLGISEQSAMVICGALALGGLKPVFYSMINFSVFRPYEMLRNIVCYHNLPVIIAGVSGSKAYRFLGLSHNITKNEDINAIWHFPNLTIKLPWSEDEVKTMISESYQSNRPSYVRL